MEQTYEQWEAINEVLGRYAFHTNADEEMAKRIVELENDIARLSQPDDIHRRYLSDCI